MNSAQKVLLAAVAVSLAVVFATPASAQYYIATINGAQETPPNASLGTGLGCFTLENDGIYDYLNYEISFFGFAETAAHIHGPALPGVPAGILFPLPAGSPKIGTIGPLFAAQLAQLNGGLWYVNIHSAAFPAGEIRGQIVAASAPCTVPVNDTTWGAIKALYR